jgi:lipopolysaccharide export system permease protein
MSNPMSNSGKLDRLILSEIVGQFVGSVLLFSGLFFAGDSLTRLAEFVQGGESWAMIGQLVLLTFPMIVSLTAPMGMLLATLMGIGRLSSDSEIIALSAAGVSFWRMMVPVVVFALCIAVPWVFLNQTFVPRSNHGRQVIIDAVKKKGGAGMSTHSPFALTIPLDDNHTMTVQAQGGVDFGETLSGRATMYDVVVLYREKGRLTQVVAGERANWILGTKNWVMKGDLWMPGRSEKETTLESATFAEEFTIKEVGTPDEVDTLSHPESELTDTQLRERVVLLRRGKDEKGARSLEVEMARRVVTPRGKGVGFCIRGRDYLCLLDVAEPRHGPRKRGRTPPLARHEHPQHSRCYRRHLPHPPRPALKAVWFARSFALHPARKLATFLPQRKEGNV